MPRKFSRELHANLELSSFKLELVVTGNGLRGVVAHFFGGAQRCLLRAAAPRHTLPPCALPAMAAAAACAHAAPAYPEQRAVTTRAACLTVSLRGDRRERMARRVKAHKHRHQRTGRPASAAGGVHALGPDHNRACRGQRSRATRLRDSGCPARTRALGGSTSDCQACPRCCPPGRRAPASHAFIRPANPHPPTSTPPSPAQDRTAALPT